MITPGEAKVGIVPASICTPGRVGLVSRSGTLTYEVVHHLTANGFGQSTCIGIGGDPIIGTDFIDVLRAFKEDPKTEAIVMIGEIGGTAEQEAAEFVRETSASRSSASSLARPPRRVGGWGTPARSSAGPQGLPSEKFAAFESAGIGIMRRPVDVVELLKDRLK